MLSALALAISNRAAADTGTGGLFNVSTPLVTAIAYERQFSTSAMPYLSFDGAGEDQRDAQDLSELDITWRMHVWVTNQNNGSDGPLARGDKIQERIFGDWTAQSNRAASYGFHHWAPSITGSGWTVVPWCVLMRRYEDHDQTGGVFHWINEFKIGIWK